MNIKNPELIKRIAEFKSLFSLRPCLNKAGMFAPTAWSRGVLLDPAILRLKAKEFLSLVDFSKIDVIAGIELQGIPLATAIALETGKPMVMVREKPKRVGRSAIVGDENFLFPGARVLLVDDLISFGGTKEKCIKLLEEQGAKVSDLAVFIYAQAVAPTKPVNADDGYCLDALKWLEEKNIKLHKLIDFVELAQLQMEAGTISKELFSFVKDQANAPHWEKTENLNRLYDFMKKENVTMEDFVLEFMKEHGVDI